MADSSYSTLFDIKNKVRRLTRSPSENQITDDQIEEYINTFVLYDFPEELRTFTLRKNLTFYTQPYVDIYGENTINTNDQLYNFKNKYISVHPPVYIAGSECYFTQAEDSFYRLYPKLSDQVKLAQGDGVTTSYSGTLTHVPFFRGNVIFSSMDSSYNAISVIDEPTIDGTTGYYTQSGDLVQQNDTSVDCGDINYITGVYTITFPTAPASGADIWVQTIPYIINTPQAVLYFDSQFVIRPVPDKSYAIQVDVMQRPTEIIDEDACPIPADTWQYIAYGAAKKIFEDRMDPDSVTIIMPEFKHQEDLILRRTLRQQSNDRSSTIYTDQTEAKLAGWGRGGWF